MPAANNVPPRPPPPRPPAGGYSQRPPWAHSYGQANTAQQYDGDGHPGVEPAAAGATATATAGAPSTGGHAVTHVTGVYEQPVTNASGVYEYQPQQQQPEHPSPPFQQQQPVPAPYVSPAPSTEAPSSTGETLLACVLRDMSSECESEISSGFVGGEGYALMNSMPVVREERLGAEEWLADSGATKHTTGDPSKCLM